MSPSIMSSFLLILTSTILTICTSQLPGAYHQGVVTVFNTVDIAMTNNCEWENSDPITNAALFPFGNFAAVDTVFFDDAVSCGECYELECVSIVDTDTNWARCDCINNAKVTVMVIDYGHDLTGYSSVFDLQQSVANNILSGGDCKDGSKYNVQYRQVCCEHLQNIAIYNYEGMTSNWLSFVVTQVRGYGSITNFWIRENGRSDYYECHRNDNGINKNWVCDPWGDDHGAYYDEYLAQGNPEFTAGNDPPYQLPIDIKIRDSNGNELESLGVIDSFTADQKFDFRKNFDAACQGDVTTDAPVTTNAPVTTDAAVTTTTEVESTTTEAVSSSTIGVESTTNTPESVTEDPWKYYVRCMDAPGEACSEAFDGDCCVRQGSNCVVPNTPSDDPVCFDVPTTTDINVGQGMDTTQNVKNPNSGNYNYVNVKLIISVVFIFYGVM